MLYARWISWANIRTQVMQPPDGFYISMHPTKPCLSGQADWLAVYLESLFPLSVWLLTSCGQNDLLRFHRWRTGEQGAEGRKEERKRRSTGIIIVLATATAATALPPRSPSTSLLIAGGVGERDAHEKQVAERRDKPPTEEKRRFKQEEER